MSLTLTQPKPRVTAEPACRDAISTFRDEMDDLLCRLWNGSGDWIAGVYSPATDLAETDNAYEIRIDMPGMTTRDFNVQVHGNTLTISGERKETRDEKGKTFHRVERRAGRFSRCLTLPCTVKEDEVAADYIQGVLTVVLPKCDASRSKKVDVKG